MSHYGRDETENSSAHILGCFATLVLKKIIIAIKYYVEIKKTECVCLKQATTSERRHLQVEVEPLWMKIDGDYYLKTPTFLLHIYFKQVFGKPGK